MPAVIALAGGYLGYVLATRQAREQRRHDHLREHIDAFYSPMVGIIQQIRARSALRAELSAASDTAWRAQVDQAIASAAKGKQLAMNISNSFAPFDRQLDYNNVQLRERLLPMYDHLVSLFTDHYWLAESSTQVHFPALASFVDLWHRHLAGSLPVALPAALQVSEATLAPLYEDLEQQLRRLAGLVTAGRAA